MGKSFYPPENANEPAFGSLRDFVDGSTSEQIRNLTVSFRDGMICLTGQCRKASVRKGVSGIVEQWRLLHRFREPVRVDIRLPEERVDDAGMEPL